MSRSKLLAFRQCPKRMWLEIHEPKLREDSPHTEAMFRTGHEVGEVDAGSTTPRVTAHRRSLVLGALLTCFGSPSARCQLAPAPGAGARAPATLAVFGDSQGDGLWGALYRKFLRTKDIRIVRASLASTGFNRTPYELTFAQTIAGEAVSVALMFTGANDAQDAWPLEKGSPPAPFGTEAWSGLYGQRLRRFHEAVAGAGIPLLWVGLPTMRDRTFESRIAKVRAEQQTLCEEFDVPTIRLEQPPTAASPPLAQPIHYEDGIHLTEATNNRFADLVICHLLTGRYDFVAGVVEVELRSATPNRCV